MYMHYTYICTFINVYLLMSLMEAMVSLFMERQSGSFRHVIDHYEAFFGSDLADLLG